MFRGIGTQGGRTSFSTVLASSTILAQGNRTEDLELAAGLMQCFPAQSMSTDALTNVPWAKEIRQLSELGQDSLWDLSLPTEYVPGTSRPAVDRRAHNLCGDFRFNFGSDYW